MNHEFLLQALYLTPPAKRNASEFQGHICCKNTVHEYKRRSGVPYIIQFTALYNSVARQKIPVAGIDRKKPSVKNIRHENKQSVSQNKTVRKSTVVLCTEFEYPYRRIEAHL